MGSFLIDSSKEANLAGLFHLNPHSIAIFKNLIFEKLKLNLNCVFYGTSGESAFLSLENIQLKDLFARNERHVTSLISRRASAHRE